MSLQDKNASGAKGYQPTPRGAGRTVSLLFSMALIAACDGGGGADSGPLPQLCDGDFEIYQVGVPMEVMLDNARGIYIFSDYEAGVIGGFDGWVAVTWENHTTSDSGAGSLQQGTRTVCAPIYGGCIETAVTLWEATVPVLPGDNDVTFHANGCRDEVFTHSREHVPKVKGFDAVLLPGAVELSGSLEAGGLDATITADYGRDETFQTSYRSMTTPALADERHAAAGELVVSDFLLPGLPHYFRMTIDNAMGSATSQTVLLIPPVDDPGQTEPFLYANGSASLITSYSARVSAMVLGNGAPYTAYVEYSANPEFIGFQESARITRYDFLDSYAGESWTLSPLAPNTRYYYRFVAYNSGGSSVTGYGSFVTAP